MTSPSLVSRRPTDYPLTAVLLVGFIALIDTLVDYFSPANGIHGTEGVVLVMVSSLLLALATGVVLNRWGPGWLRTLLEVLIVLDFIGTAVAGYFLEDWILVVLMVLGFVAWLVHFTRRPPYPAS